jgi:predicted amidohydrolase YtcJ
MRIRSALPIIILATLAIGPGAKATAAAAVSAPAADLIVNHARIWTGNPAQAEAQALAVLGGRIVAVGSESEVAAWRGSATTVVDASGKRLIPGFDDAHTHVLWGGAQLTNVQLNDATSAEEFARRIGDRARHARTSEWIQGGNWDETKWTPASLPTHQLIDAVAPDVPVAVSRYDGHMIVVNSIVLKLAGISAQTRDPVGGVIVRDANGEPTGALKDSAVDLVTRVIPPISKEQRRAILERALKYATSVGVTSLQDMSDSQLADDYANLAIYSELAEQGRLPVRVYAAPSITGVDDLAKIGVRRAFGSAMLRIGALKTFADGSVGSRTAYFFNDFDDSPGDRGLLSDNIQPLTMAADRMSRADAAGLQLYTHAIGDEAISTILDLYTEVQKRNGVHERRWRIEHAQHMAAKDFDRFRELGVIASVQPYHAIDDGRWVEKRIGHDRSSRTYAFRTFLDHGVRLALGTDWPVAPLDPMQTLYAATTRATLDGKNPNGWYPEQKLTVTEALSAYTLGSAYSEFQDLEKGTLENGKLADFVLLSADILQIPPQQIRNTTVLKTWVGGKLVFTR